jgi:hypothetical protein
MCRNVRKISGHSSKADGVRGRSLSHAYASHTTRLMKASTAAIKGPKAPISIRFSNTWREDGLTSKEISGKSRFLLLFRRQSRNHVILVCREPKTTWFTNPLTSLTVTTSPGLPEVQLKALWWPNQFQFLYHRWRPRLLLVVPIGLLFLLVLEFTWCHQTEKSCRASSVPILAMT